MFNARVLRVVAVGPAVAVYNLSHHHNIPSFAYISPLRILNLPKPSLKDDKHAETSSLPSVHTFRRNGLREHHGWPPASKAPEAILVVPTAYHVQFLQRDDGDRIKRQLFERWKCFCFALQTVLVYISITRADTRLKDRAD